MAGDIDRMGVDPQFLRLYSAFMDGLSGHMFTVAGMVQSLRRLTGGDKASREFIDSFEKGRGVMWETSDSFKVRLENNALHLRLDAAMWERINEHLGDLAKSLKAKP
jgi:hypothetical protein